MISISLSRYRAAMLKELCLLCIDNMPAAIDPSMVFAQYLEVQMESLVDLEYGT